MISKIEFERPVCVDLLLGKHPDIYAVESIVKGIHYFIEFPEEKEKFEKNGIGYRLGNTAYDIREKALKGNGIKPLFISKKDHEKYEELQMSELNKIGR